MEVRKYKKTHKEVAVVIFPDSGPEQYDVYKWIDENGGKSNLYDGCAEDNVKTSTSANWRWKSISIDGCDKWCKVGDYIVKDVDGCFRVFTPSEFVKLFR